MGWNETVEQEYDEMLTGNIWDALDFMYGVNEDIAKTWIKNAAEKLENRDFEGVRIDSVSNINPSHYDIEHLHANRVACCLWAERVGIFPWKLADKSTEELKPLLSFHYQGFIYDATSSKYYFHRIWDLKSGERVLDATSLYALFPILVLFGAIGLDEIPATEEEMIYYLIQHFRDSGWGHYSLNYLEFEGYPDHGTGQYDYEIVSQVKCAGCHLMSEYLVATLRSFNIPSHIGPGWESAPPPDDLWDYTNSIHGWGHCFVHFSSIGKWFNHGDNVYNRLLKTLPIEFSFRSEYWMYCNFLNASEYEYKRAQYYDDYFLWCLFLGQSPSYSYDVRYLYSVDQLRNTLETLHDGLENREGAPVVIPPIFTPDEVDFLMAWVEKIIAREQAQ